MVDIKGTLNQYKQYIVFIGFIVGALMVFDVAPSSVDLLGLKENIKFVYLAVIALSFYVFYAFYYNVGPSVGFQRTVQPRTLHSDPAYLRALYAQRGEYPRPRVPPQQYAPPPQSQPQQPQQQQQAAPDIWNTFNKE